ncbi:unnamed protein product [Somion occarium]
MYYEKPTKKKGKSEKIEDTPRSMEDHVVREGERDTFVKLTYSAYRSDPSDASAASSSSSLPSSSKSHEKDTRKPRKWHLNAYFTKHTEGELRTIDDIPELRGLIVPEGLYKTARSTPKNVKKAGELGKDASGAERTGAGKTGGVQGTQKERIYAAFPSSHPSTRPSQSMSMTQTYPVYPSGQGPGSVVFQQDPDIKMTSSSEDASSLPTVTVPPSHQPTTSLNAIVNVVHLPGYVSPEAESAYMQASSGYPNYASYASQLPSASSQTQTYEEGGQTNPGSGYGSSEPSPSPMSEYSSGSWHQHHQQPSHRSSLSNQYTHSHPYAHIHTPFAHHPDHPNASQSHLHLNHFNRHRHHTHTPALSDTSHSSSSSSPYSISVPMGMGMGGLGGVGSGLGGMRVEEDDEEDLSGYVPAPPPFILEHSNASFTMDDPDSHLAHSHHSRSPPHLPDLHLDDYSSGEHDDSNLHGHRSGNSSSGRGDDNMSESGRSAGGRSSEDGAGGAGGGSSSAAARVVALAPLRSLQRNHPYRRWLVDDKALRMLGPSA